MVAAGQEIDARVRHAWPPQGQRHPNTRHRIGLYVGAESRVMPRRNFAENTPEYGGRGGWSFIDATFAGGVVYLTPERPHNANHLAERFSFGVPQWTRHLAVFILSQIHCPKRPVKDTPRSSLFLQQHVTEMSETRPAVVAMRLMEAS